MFWKNIYLIKLYNFSLINNFLNFRFDIRCSFIFLLLLCGAWFTAYFYLRRSKMDDEMSQLYGYLFIGFNTMMGIYIFVFHCIQNEKVKIILNIIPIVMI